MGPLFRPWTAARPRTLSCSGWLWPPGSWPRAWAWPCWPPSSWRRASSLTTCRERSPARRRRGAGPMTAGVTVDLLDPTPPYEQLRRQFATLIETGQLRPEDRLPRSANLPATSTWPPARSVGPIRNWSPPASSAAVVVAAPVSRSPGRHRHRAAATPDRRCPDVCRTRRPSGESPRRAACTRAGLVAVILDGRQLGADDRPQSCAPGITASRPSPGRRRGDAGRRDTTVPGRAATRSPRPGGSHPDCAGLSAKWWRPPSTRSSRGHDGQLSKDGMGRRNGVRRSAARCPRGSTPSQRAGAERHRISRPPLRQRRGLRLFHDQPGPRLTCRDRSRAQHLRASLRSASVQPPQARAAESPWTHVGRAPASRDRRSAATGGLERGETG